MDSAFYLHGPTSQDNDTTDEPRRTHFSDILSLFALYVLAFWFLRPKKIIVFGDSVFATVFAVIQGEQTSSSTVLMLKLPFSPCNVSSPIEFLLKRLSHLFCFRIDQLDFCYPGFWLLMAKSLCITTSFSGTSTFCILSQPNTPA